MKKYKRAHILFQSAGRVVSEMVFTLSILMILFAAFPLSLSAVISGECVNCHTMHNSQNNAPMATYASGESWGDTGPNSYLVRGNECLGCHGMNTTQRIVSIGGSDFPQVIHRDPVGDLAGGNFAYILGTKGSGASDSKGHNVIDIGNIDDTLTAPPGQWHDHQIRNTNFTCAGARGCHGTRGPSLSSGLRNMGGTHHNNVDGKLNTANNVYDSYRFLLGVQGLENPGASRWQNWSATDHNEYFGKSFPLSGGSCNNCHIVGPSNIVSPASRTISGFCGTCHGNFHWLDDPNSVDGGIGGDTISPFTRHPTDIVLPNSGEYASYTTYSVEAPIARQVVPDNPSNTVTPGTDVVMCLSCHAAHATDNPDMLRWDYATMIAGGGGSGGCFTCHTTKN